MYKLISYRKFCCRYDSPVSNFICPFKETKRYTCNKYNNSVNLLKTTGSILPTGQPGLTALSQHSHKINTKYSLYGAFLNKHVIVGVAELTVMYYLKSIPIHK
jgi:hypothetical protein